MLQYPAAFRCTLLWNMISFTIKSSIANYERTKERENINNSQLTRKCSEPLLFPSRTPDASCVLADVPSVQTSEFHPSLYTVNI